MTILKLLLSSLLLLSFSLSAQLTNYKELHGTVYKKDGSKIEGLIKIPNKSSTKNVNIELNKKNKIKMKSTDIDSIIIIPPNTTEEIFLTYTKTKAFPPFSLKRYIEAQNYWLRRIIKGEMSLYYAKDVTRYQKAPVVVTNFYGYRKGDEYPKFLHQDEILLVSIGENATFRKYISKYFENDPEMLDKINTKEYKADLAGIMQMVTDYNQRHLKNQTKPKEEKNSKTQKKKKK